jgi:gliding-associated putative ABC transporter substrate-binding component GldG
MKKLLNSKYWWISWLLLLLAINYLASIFHYRIDFTQEKRYTLSKTTKNLLGSLEEVVTVDVFLKGNLKSGVRKLAQSTNELLQDFKDYSNGRLRVRFIDPISDYDDSTAAHIIDSLSQMGISPMTQVAQSAAGDEQSQRIVIPGAIISYKDQIYPVNLLSGVKNTENDEIYTNAEALLEYKFSFAINKLTQKKVPLLGYVTGNGEPLGYTAFSALNFLSRNYRIDSLNLATAPYIPAQFEALVMVQPSSAFTDQQKLKLDQYVMNGGKLLVFLDVLDASMDSLRGRNETVAFNKGLNLDDLFFKYGVRINDDLVQDMLCAQISLVIGMVGDKPQFQLLKWPYYPLLSGSLTHPVSKNLDPVYSKFANSIDTVKADGVRKTVLLSTSANGRTISTPALISFESIKVADDPNVFNKPYLPVGMLLEGKFSSLFANRLSAATRDSIQKVSGLPYLPAGGRDSKIIIVADGNIVLNEVEEQRGPLPMGFSKDINYTFANQDFFQNCVEYLTDPAGILESRAKDFTLRLLDAKKVADKRSLWQMINIGAPILLVILFGLIYQALRKRKYQL